MHWLNANNITCETENKKMEQARFCKPSVHQQEQAEAESEQQIDARVCHSTDLAEVHFVCNHVEL